MTDTPTPTLDFPDIEPNPDSPELRTIAEYSYSEEAVYRIQLDPDRLDPRDRAMLAGSLERHAQMLREC